jgi:hypothetical protein
MNIRKLGVVLLALLLAGMAIVPYVSAADVISGTEVSLQIPDDGLVKTAEIQEIIALAKSNDHKLADVSDQAEMNAFISPAETIITEMKKRSYSEDQITAVLISQGYDWDVKTGACWKGTPPTEAEQKIISQIRGPDYSPFDRVTDDKAAGIATLDPRQEYRQLKTSSGTTYFGVYDYMKPGQMVTSSTGTHQHVITTHVGRKPSSTTESWTEAGVASSVPDPTRQYFTYDNDEGLWLFHGTASATTLKTYQIYVTDTLESAGYKYHIWIGGSWVRSGHLAYRENYVDQANEIWAYGSIPFSSDTSITEFRDSYLYHSGGYSMWGTYLPTDVNFMGSRISESKTISGNAYDWQMWIP